MSDDPAADVEATAERVATLAASLASSYKVRGKYAGANGAGVLGYNTAGSGTPVGVQGVVDDAAGYGLETPDDTRIEGSIEATSGHTLTVDGRDILRLGPKGTDSDGDTGGGNVVGGWEGNTANDAIAATIGGGGGAASAGDRENQVTDNYGTVGGGKENTAGDAQSGTDSAPNATVGGGQGNTASGENATVGGGESNQATAFDATVGGGKLNRATDRWATIAGGDQNEATDDDATVGGGAFNTAAGSDSTIAGGDDNTAIASSSTIGGGANNRTGTSGIFVGDYATIPGGRNNIASRDDSFAAGRQAEAKHDGAFVWADSTDASVTSTGSNQFLIEAGGGTGIGTTGPVTTAHVQDAVAESGDENLGRHVLAVENTSTSSSPVPDVLGLELTNVTDPGNFHSYISFMDSTGTIGNIQGDGNGGVEFVGSLADFAEFFPKADPEVEFADGEVVGLREGEAVSLEDDTDPDAVLVVSTAPLVTGNRPTGDMTDRSDHVKLSLVGQVPVRVSGPVESGDLVVPSGEADGTGRAVPPEKWNPGDGPLVGRALDSDETDGVSEVTVAVGVDDPTLLGDRLTEYRDRIDALETEIERLREQIDSQREGFQARLEAFEDRLTAVEPGQAEAQTPADD